MKRFSTLVTLCFSVVALAAASVSFQAQDPAIAKATKFVTALQKGNYQAAYAEVDSNLGFQITPEKLGRVWKSLTAKAGPLVEIKRSKVERKSGYYIVTQVAKFKKGHVDIQIALDNMLKVADFGFKNHKAEPRDKSASKTETGGEPVDPMASSSNPKPGVKTATAPVS